MANEEHVGLLKQGVEVWNAWRQQEAGDLLAAPELLELYGDLSGAILRGEDLCDANLIGANLGFADLSGTHLFGADCRGASFNMANLLGTDFRRANLARAYFGLATLRWAVFEGSLTAAARGALLTSGRDGETAPVSRTEKRYQVGSVR